MSSETDINNLMQNKTNWEKKQDKLEAASKDVGVQKKEYDKIIHSTGVDLDDLKWTGETLEKFKKLVFEDGKEQAKYHYGQIEKVQDGLKEEAREAGRKASYFDREIKQALFR